MQTFLFDIGNVILFFDFQLAVQRVAARCQLTADEILPALRPLTEAFERGETETEEFCKLAADRIGFSDAPRQLVSALEDIFIVNSPMVELIESLKRDGHALYLLSNTNAIHVPFFTSQYAVFEHFDGAIYSHEIGAMKPDAAIYRAAIDRFDLDPHQTIYIDDLEANIATGQEFGLKSIRYHGDDHTAFLRALEGLI